MTNELKPVPGSTSAERLNNPRFVGDWGEDLYKRVRFAYFIAGVEEVESARIMGAMTDYYEKNTGTESESLLVDVISRVLEDLTLCMHERNQSPHLQQKNTVAALDLILVDPVLKAAVRRRAGMPVLEKLTPFVEWGPKI